MHIDLRTVSIKPQRQTFDHIARRIGPDKTATRYQEGTLDVQATHNFHYRPTWDPDYEIFYASRSAIRMADWYLCGPPLMIDACISTLMQGRLFENDIFTEKFFSAADAQQVRSPLFKRV